MIMNVEDSKLDLFEKLNIYFSEDNFIMSFNGKQFSVCLNKGWKFCSLCRYIVNTDKVFCPICRKKYRIKIRSIKSKKSTDWFFSEPLKYNILKYNNCPLINMDGIIKIRE